jgi:hypothetical protein
MYGRKIQQVHHWQLKYIAIFQWERYFPPYESHRGEAVVVHDMKVEASANWQQV